MSKKVFIGIGHGGADPGACANGFEEKDLNLDIGLACVEELTRHGLQVLASRTKDEEDLLADTIKEANAFDPVLAVDIHNNAGKGDGAEVFHTYKGGEGKVLAEKILAEIKAIGQNSRGAKTKKNKEGNDNFGFIRSIKAPSIIVECAFVDNKTDLAIIDTPAERQAMGVAIAKGILAYLGLAWIDPAATQTKTRYTVQVGVYSSKAAAEKALAALQKEGFDGFVTTTDREAAPAPAPALKVGDKVKLAKDATVYGKTTKFTSWVYSSTLYVREISGDRVVISTQKTGAVTGAVHQKHLVRV